MEDRTVLQWDKDDCAVVGLVKFDLLGLGMLTAIHEAIDIVRDAHGVDIDIAMLPQDADVYDMLCEADTVGVFQIESRAQMATLPRLKPRTFYDLVVEVALIRPGPIQGGSVHPYIRRRNGQEPVTYLHPLLEAGACARRSASRCSRSSSCRSRSTWRGSSRCRRRRAATGHGVEALARAYERLKGRFYDGMARHGITGEIADADLGQARRVRELRLPRIALGVVRVPRLHLGVAASTTTRPPSARRCSTHSRWASGHRTHSWPTLGVTASASAASTSMRRARRPPSTADGALRLGISYVRTIGEDLAKTIEAGRPYTDDRRCRRPLRADAPAGRGARDVRSVRVLRAVASQDVVDVGSRSTGQGTLAGSAPRLPTRPSCPDMTVMRGGGGRSVVDVDDAQRLTDGVRRANGSTEIGVLHGRRAEDRPSTDGA